MLGKQGIANLVIVLGLIFGAMSVTAVVGQDDLPPWDGAFTWELQGSVADGFAYVEGYINETIPSTGKVRQAPFWKRVQTDGERGTAGSNCVTDECQMQYETFTTITLVCLQKGRLLSACYTMAVDDFFQGSEVGREYMGFLLGVWDARHELVFVPLALGQGDQPEGMGPQPDVRSGPDTIGGHGRDGR